MPNYKFYVYLRGKDSSVDGMGPQKLSDLGNAKSSVVDAVRRKHSGVTDSGTLTASSKPANVRLTGTALDSLRDAYDDSDITGADAKFEESASGGSRRKTRRTRRRTTRRV